MQVCDIMKTNSKKLEKISNCKKLLEIKVNKIRIIGYLLNENPLKNIKEFSLANCRC